MKLDIISPEKVLFSGNVVSVTLPGVMGGFTILENHAPVISSLQKGILVYRQNENDKEIEVPINGGFVEGKNNEINACID